MTLNGQLRSHYSSSMQLSAPCWNSSGGALPKRALATLLLRGGVALNATTNGILERADAGVSRLFVQPASSDAGLSLGAAYAANFSATGSLSGTQPQQDSLGRSYPRDRLLSALQEAQLTFSTDGDSAVNLAEMLAQGAVLALFEGGSEFGPRALGKRSILADPRPMSMHQHLNLKVKGREWFRPFAPAVLAEEVDLWFDRRGAGDYMLSTTQVLLERRRCVPAIVHSDGSARVQVVRSGHGFLRRLLEAFYARTGVPILVNTSLNVAGEPIVETPEEAVSAFCRAAIDVLWLDGLVVIKPRSSFSLDSIAVDVTRVSPVPERF